MKRIFSEEEKGINDLNKNENFSFNFCGKKVTFEINKVAKKAEKSVVCRYGETVVLTTICSKEIDSRNNFSHLSISIDEKYYSISKIPSNFNRREGRPSQEAILTSRIIDRSLRPLIKPEIDEEIQIINSLLWVDENSDPRLPMCWNSFIVLLLSNKIEKDIISTLSLAEVNGQLICNPSFEQLRKSSFEMFATFSGDKIIMVEAFCDQITNLDFLNSLEFLIENSKSMVDFYKELFSSDFWSESQLKKQQHLEDKNSYLVFEKSEEGESLKKEVFSILDESKKWSIKNRDLQNFLNKFVMLSKNSFFVYKKFSEIIRDVIKKELSSKGKRINGRLIDQIREIEINANYLPNSHGSCLFSRGETSVLSVVTYGSFNKKKVKEENFLPSFSRNFIHHYNFPTFSVGEISNSRSFSRREIGHGNLVERSFLNLIPSFDDFPYLIRVVSEVLSAEGSSSQASICSSSIALMYAGFPLDRHVAGIALGLFGDFIVVDIDDLEDGIGDADFKISGTKFGICSLQLDVKKQGIGMEKIKEFLEKAKIARLFIIEKMEEEISEPKKSLPSSSLKCKKFYIEKEKIGFVIGQKGKNIELITSQTGVKIDFHDNHAFVFHFNEKNIDDAYEIILKLIAKSY